VHWKELVSVITRSTVQVLKKTRLKNTAPGFVLCTIGTAYCITFVFRQRFGNLSFFSVEDQCHSS